MNNNKLYKISVDAMGGDHGLKTTIPACISALNRYKNLYICIVGIYDQIKQELKKYNNIYDHKRMKIYHSNEIVTMNESPSLVLRKKDTSMRIAIQLLKNKTVDACISAGNTGALMATSIFILKTLNYINRPAIVYPIPSSSINDNVYMLDLGANIKVSSEQLFKFGIMGSVIASNIKSKKHPRVSLLNIGKEDIKGLDYIKETAKMFKSCKNINYIGYIEANEIFFSTADVIVCDGFTGNIALKTIEGTAKYISDMINNSFKKNFWSKIAMMISFPVLKHLKKKLNINKYNGASLLGLSGIVIKSHGSATPEAFEYAIYQAINEIQINIPKKIQDLLNTEIK